MFLFPNALFNIRERKGSVVGMISHNRSDWFFSLLSINLISASAFSISDLNSLESCILSLKQAKSSIHLSGREISDSILDSLLKHSDINVVISFASVSPEFLSSDTFKVYRIE